MRILAVSDGEHSSGTTVLKGIARHSKHQIEVVQYNVKRFFSDHDIIYMHMGSLLLSPAWSTAKPNLAFFKQRKGRTVRWGIGITGWSCLKKMLVPIKRRFRFHDVLNNREIIHIRCPSKEMERMVKYIQPDLETFVCHSGVDTSKFIASSPPKEFSIGWAGNTRTFQKHFWNFLKLPFPQKIAKGWIPHRKMPDFYRDISVLVSTSTAEGSPLPPKEAAASGRPVVALTVGDLPEWVPSEWLVEFNEHWRDWDFRPAKDETAFKALIPLINRLRDDKALYHKECKRFRRLSLQFDWKKVALEYDEMFDRLGEM